MSLLEFFEECRAAGVVDVQLELNGDGEVMACKAKVLPQGPPIARPQPERADAPVDPATGYTDRDLYGSA